MTTQTGFVHEAWLYDDDNDYVDQLSSLADTAVAADEPVLLAVPAARHELLRASIGHSDRVTMADMSTKGANPGRIIPTVLQDFMDKHPGRRVTIVGEPVWPGRSNDAYAAAVQHEALINVAFEGRHATIVCPYDRGKLDAAAIEDACGTHPIVRERQDRRVSSTYMDPTSTAEVAIGTPSAPPAHAQTIPFWSLAVVRAAVAAEAARVNLAAVRAVDLQTAANEVATNSLHHSGGGGELSVWSEAGHVVCEIRDTGQIEDPLVGRRPPLQNLDPGRGLILTHQLCDLVQIWNLPSGTTTRMWTNLTGVTRPT